MKLFRWRRKKTVDIRHIKIGDILSVSEDEAGLSVRFRLIDGIVDDGSEGFPRRKYYI